MIYTTYLGIQIPTVYIFYGWRIDFHPSYLYLPPRLNLILGQEFENLVAVESDVASDVVVGDLPPRVPFSQGGLRDVQPFGELFDGEEVIVHQRFPFTSQVIDFLLFSILTKSLIIPSSSVYLWGSTFPRRL